MVRETLSRARHTVRGFQTAAYSRISAPIQGLHQAAYLLAGLTLASQMLSLLRDRTFAHTFGAGQVLDLYYAAFRVPDLVFAIVSSLVSAYVIIPRIAHAEPTAVRRLLSETATFLLVAGGVVCAVLAVLMPELLTALFPNLMQGSESGAFVLLARLLLIQPILLGLSGIVSSVTQVHRRFALFALSPVLYNLGIIVGTVYGYPLFGLPGIGLGVVLGALAYLLVQVPVLASSGVMPHLMWPKLRDMLPIVRDSVPRSLALGMNSITALALTAVASRMSSGAVSVFTFATNLAAVPLALIGSSYAVAAFPALSEASDDRAAFANILSASARHILVWSLVSFGLIIALRAHVVRVILGTGAFDWEATRLTAALFVVLAFGLAADALELLFNRALYAARQSWRPFLYQLVAGGLTRPFAEVLHPRKSPNT
jgi:putative peptidoglycan lipid II flippase